MSAEQPEKGEVWKYGWLFVTITKAGPKRVTYWTGTESLSTPTDRFLSRFHRTGLRRADSLATDADGSGHT